MITFSTVGFSLKLSYVYCFLAISAALFSVIRSLAVFSIDGIAVKAPVTLVITPVSSKWTLKELFSTFIPSTIWANFTWVLLISSVLTSTTSSSVSSAKPISCFFSCRNVFAASSPGTWGGDSSPEKNICSVCFSGTKTTLPVICSA